MEGEHELARRSQWEERAAAEKIPDRVDLQRRWKFDPVRSPACHVADRSSGRIGAIQRTISSRRGHPSIGAEYDVPMKDEPPPMAWPDVPRLCFGPGDPFELN